MNSETILALLQTAVCEMEEESDVCSNLYQRINNKYCNFIIILFQKLAEKFLCGDTDLEGFLEEFLKQRKEMHMRKAKADKMVEMLSRRNNSFRPSNDNIQLTTPGYPLPVYTPRPNSSYFQPTSMPYPNVPINMPMPGNSFINRHF